MGSAQSRFVSLGRPGWIGKSFIANEQTVRGSALCRYQKDLPRPAGLKIDVYDLSTVWRPSGQESRHRRIGELLVFAPIHPAPPERAFGVGNISHPLAVS